MNKLNFCICTGSNYIAKAVTMYESLKKHCADFTLYYFCFDTETYECLVKLKLENIVPVKISEIEDEQLLKAKKNRSLPEYFFTLTPSIILYAITEYNLDMCIYLDADLYFFNSPDILLKEMKASSILITEHHPHSNEYHKEGKYNVQFIPFRNDEYGINVLKWWRDRCIEWCFLRAEDGKWADQGYLNVWLEKFDKIKVLEYLGAIGPWNVRYSVIYNSGNEIKIKMKNYDIYSLVFYHFQGLQVLHNKTVRFSGSVDIPSNFIEFIYKPYSEHLLRIGNEINKTYPKIDSLGKMPRPRSLASIKHIFKTHNTISNITKMVFKKITIKIDRLEDG